MILIVCGILCSRYMIINSFIKKLSIKCSKQNIPSNTDTRCIPKIGSELKHTSAAARAHRHRCPQPCVHMPMPLLSSVTMSAGMCPGPRPSPPLPAPLCAHAHPLLKSFLSKSQDYATLTVSFLHEASVPRPVTNSLDFSQAKC